MEFIFRPRKLAPTCRISRRGCVANQSQRDPSTTCKRRLAWLFFGTLVRVYFTKYVSCLNSGSIETAKIEGKGSGCQVARELSSIADQFGVVKTFRTYLDVMNQLDDNFSTIRRELYSSGVTMVDCPSHSGRDIADKVIIGKRVLKTVRYGTLTRLWQLTCLAL